MIASVCNKTLITADYKLTIFVCSGEMHIYMILQCCLLQYLLDSSVWFNISRILRNLCTQIYS